jgi:hypothetical protein
MKTRTSSGLMEVAQALESGEPCLVDTLLLRCLGRKVRFIPTKLAHYPYIITMITDAS